MRYTPPTDESPATLIAGDCRDVLDRLPGRPERPWAVVCDPPYGIALRVCADGPIAGLASRHGGESGRVIENDTDLKVVDDITSWSDHRGTMLCLFASPFRPLPGDWRNILVWNKGEAVGAGGSPEVCFKRTIELVYIRRNGPLRCGRDGSLLNFPVGPGKDFALHPCQKPLPLLRYLIRQLTDPDDIVLDPCMGSGSTLCAALLEGRRCVGIEVDPRFFSVAEKRVAKYVRSYQLARKITKTTPGGVDLFGHALVD